MDGWVKLHRQSLENGWLKNHKMWVFWTYCLMKATHKELKQMVGNQQIELLPGQFVFGRKAAAKELNMSEQTIRTCLNNLKKLKNITIKPTNKYTIITIDKWDEYQTLIIDSNHQTNQTPTSSQPAPNHKQEQENIEVFIKPTFEEVKAEFKKKGLSDKISDLITTSFMDHYDDNGWTRNNGKIKLKRWKGCVATFILQNKNLLKRAEDNGGNGKDYPKLPKKKNIEDGKKRELKESLECKKLLEAKNE